jgi:hypothetical protein
VRRSEVVSQVKVGITGVRFKLDAADLHADEPLLIQGQVRPAQVKTFVDHLQERTTPPPWQVGPMP